MQSAVTVLGLRAGDSRGQRHYVIGLSVYPYVCLSTPFFVNTISQDPLEGIPSNLKLEHKDELIRF